MYLPMTVVCAYVMSTHTCLCYMAFVHVCLCAHDCITATYNIIVDKAELVCRVAPQVWPRAATPSLRPAWEPRFPGSSWKYIDGNSIRHVSKHHGYVAKAA